MPDPREVARHEWFKRAFFDQHLVGDDEVPPEPSKKYQSAPKPSENDQSPTQSSASSDDTYPMMFPIEMDEDCDKDGDNAGAKDDVAKEDGTKHSAKDDGNKEESAKDDSVEDDAKDDTVEDGVKDDNAEAGAKNYGKGGGLRDDGKDDTAADVGVEGGDVEDGKVESGGTLVEDQAPEEGEWSEGEIYDKLGKFKVQDDDSRDEA